MSKSTKKTTTTAPKMTAENLKPSKEKLESAIEAQTAKNMQTFNAYECIPAGKTSWYGAVGGKGSRHIESAAFVAMLINANFVKMTRQGRLEKVSGKPYLVGLVAKLYGSRTPISHHKLTDKGFSDDALLHFNNRLSGITSWHTSYELVRKFRDVMSGKVKEFVHEFEGRKVTVKRGDQVSISVAK